MALYDDIIFNKFKQKLEQSTVLTDKLNNTKVFFNWKPQPRQQKFIDACGFSYVYNNTERTKAKAKMVLYGGSAGGGKSDALLGLAYIAGTELAGINIGYFRRQYSDLSKPGCAIARSHEMYTGLATWNSTDHKWTLPNRSIIQFCHCNTENDVYSYKSSQFDIILIDEATEFSEFILLYLLSRNRATKNHENFTPFMAMGSNPGGIGHGFFKEKFINAGVPETVHNVEMQKGKYTNIIFIPAKLSDNKILEDRDPDYRNNLELQDEQNKRMLLDGDWDVYTGQYFSEFRRNIHVVDPFEIPEHWRRYITLDYGLDMFAVYFIALSPQRVAYVYKELYQKDLIVSDAAQKLKSMIDKNEEIYQILAPPDLWNRNRDTGKSSADIFYDNGLLLHQSINDRVSGWYNLKEWLKPYKTQHEQTGEEITTANILFFKNCINAIRCIPLLQHDKNNPNDVANEPHEITHAPDAIRYFVATYTKPVKSSMEELSGTYTYQMLVLKGYKDFHIKQMWKNGQIKLIGHPWK